MATSLNDFNQLKVVPNDLFMNLVEKYGIFVNEDFSVFLGSAK